LVFDQGKIIEDGTHDALMQQQGHYATMWRMQAGGFLPEHAIKA
jgi:ATP-binding cassette subfamily B protein